MPYLKLQSNCEIDPKQQPDLLATLSRTVSEALGKSENYVMIVLDTAKPMFFAGNDAPAAFLELKSLGLPDERTAELSAALCEALEGHLGIPAARVYVEFAAPARHLWGWNGRTF